MVLSRAKRFMKKRRNLVVFVIIFASMGVAALIVSKAATPATSFEAENGTISGCASKISDVNASGGSAVQLGDSGSGCSSTTGAGAQLPISYDLGLVTGTVRYVAPNGSDTAAGTQAAPFATLNKGITSLGTGGGTVVVRGGTYRQGNIIMPAKTGSTVNQPIRILAYPGEIPIFNGAKTTSGWTSEGSLKYISGYTPQPATAGSGIDFPSGANLNGAGIGKYPDQAWVNNTQLQQVSAKTDVNNDSKFWVDIPNNRLYLSAANADTNKVEVSGLDGFLDGRAVGTVLEGIRVMRYSNSANDYGVIKFSGTASNAQLRNVEVIDTAFIAVMYGDTSGSINANGLLKNVTISGSNWMGVSASITDDFTMDAVKVIGLDPYDEFSSSPQSGALKTSRTWRTKVINSEILDNKSHGLWFDQSNYQVVVANSTFSGNTGSTVFFEISDDLLFINNYVKAGGGEALKIAGSSGVKLINNTLVGGKNILGIYTDSRSVPGCVSSSANCLGASNYSSDRDAVHTRPVTLDWMPRIDLMINNIIAHPTSSQYCGTNAVCITESNPPASAALNTIIHKADASRGIPQTQMNGNVYANGTAGTNQIIWASSAGNWKTLPLFISAMQNAPVGIPNLESNGQYGNSWVNADGSPSTSLLGIHSQAFAVPTNAIINQYIPAGTKHYGVTFK